MAKAKSKAVKEVAKEAAGVEASTTLTVRGRAFSGSCNVGGGKALVVVLNGQQQESHHLAIEKGQLLEVSVRVVDA